jgi:hypothetical protein
MVWCDRQISSVRLHSVLCMSRTVTGVTLGARTVCWNCTRSSLVQVSPLWCPSARQLSRYVPTDAGCMSDTATVLRDTRLRDGRPRRSGLNPGGTKINIFYFPHRPAPTEWITTPLSPRGIRRPRREADHSLPPSVEVNNKWSYTSTPSFISWTRTILPLQCN